MEQLNDTITQIVEMLGKLYGLPAFGLVFIVCLAVGYGLRLWKKFPNDGIPLAVILCGPVFLPLIADPAADSIPWRIWFFKNFLIGLIVGVAAWVAHNKLLSKFEDKIPFLGDKLAAVDAPPNPNP
jgi:hypothetical protein